MSKFEKFCAGVGLLFIMVCYFKFWIWLSRLAYFYLDGVVFEIVETLLRIAPVAVLLLVLMWLELHYEKRKK